MKISVVCCDSSPEKLSRIVEIELAPAELERRVLETAEQQLAPGEARDLHNAAHHVEHGPVTYVQQVTAGGFSVSVGKPDDLEETYFGKDSFVAFMDDEGPGHGSKVGPEGVTRTFRILKGHLSV